MSSVGNVRPPSAAAQAGLETVTPRPPSGPRPPSTGRRTVRSASRKTEQGSPSTRKVSATGSSSPQTSPGPDKISKDRVSPVVGRIRSAELKSREKTTGDLPNTSSRQIPASHIRPARSSSASQVEGKSAHHQEDVKALSESSKPWQDIVAIIKEINVARQEKLVDLDTLCEKCQRLHAMIKAAKGDGEVQQELSAGRKAILTSIFRLLPMKHPPTVLWAARVAFEVRLCSGTSTLSTS